jgi:hypothetical protein
MSNTNTNETAVRTIWIVSLTGGKGLRFALVPAATEEEAHRKATSWASLRGRRDIVWTARRTEASWRPAAGAAALAEHAERCRKCEISDTFNTARAAWTFAANLGLRS